MKKIARALISVSDKTGLADFAAGLAALGIEILSTGGTGRLLRDRGLLVRDVSSVTGFPEMLGGRVKTLHPKIHAGILAVRSNAEHREALRTNGIDCIDLVVANLYPFEQTARKAGVTLEELIEEIDIGGPTLVRAAAKNFEDVAVVADPQDYGVVLDELRKNGGGLSRETRWRLARKTFAVTASYDAAISTTLQKRSEAQSGSAPETLPEYFHLSLRKLRDLRYGENPHQKAALYGSSAACGLAAAKQVQGKELSFNNLVDLEAGWRLVGEFPEPATAVIKHSNPCGVATGETLAESSRRALQVDPVSAFGSVIAFNRAMDAETSETIAQLFVEAAVAPGYAPQALSRLSGKKNLRVLEMPADAGRPAAAESDRALRLKTFGGGLLVQTPDDLAARPEDWKCVTRRSPGEEEKQALVFAWRVVKHVKSNAIVFARRGVVVGIGAGQMSRVDSVKVAIAKARELGHSLEGTVVASDAFFPFSDGVEQAAQAGARAIVQPGGSIRDAEVIAAADRLGLAMLFTGVRHFLH